MLSLKKFSSHVFIFVDIICLGFWVYCNDRFQRGLKRKPMALIKKLRKAVRGDDLDALLDMSDDVLVKLFPAIACCRFHRGLKSKPMASIKKLRKAER
ncbi:hypothetical protein NC653_013013 [Populus alba x Populus x berolinensis]|uniref:Uncharacterized protein n=1 Tax=Populus alba x Populus x berolinensis TaxID=444605 RepID=A0AAD6QTL4_9ROSI|nr:hypothetical protein NC653_013013 [Populus alba x Populus x berolinensis]